MANDITFGPHYGSGQTVAPGAASATSTFNGKGNKSVVLTNLDAVTVFVRIGNADLGDASAADYPVLAGTQVSISKADEHDNISYIAASGTGSLHFMAGDGF